jgi:hypothetical protein
MCMHTMYKVLSIITYDFKMHTRKFVNCEISHTNYYLVTTVT